MASDINLGGRPPIFESPDQLEGLFFDYADYCTKEELMPNIAGFCTYLKRFRGISVHRDTYYATAQREGFSDTIKSIDGAIEDSVLNCKYQKDLLKIAYLNNKCGYTNNQKIDMNATNLNMNTDLDMDLFSKKATEEEKANQSKLSGEEILRIITR